MNLGGSLDFFIEKLILSINSKTNIHMDYLMMLGGSLDLCIVKLISLTSKTNIFNRPLLMYHAQL